MGEGDTGVNALIGALVSVVLVGAIPFAPVLGGAVAGYLQGGRRSDGVRVGLFSGLIALVPGIVIGLFIGAILLSVVGLAGGAGPAALFGTFGGLILAFIFFAIAIYIVAFSMLGGWLGNYLKYETDVDF